MKYLVTSDIHLGHPRTPTKHIINSFKQTILTEKNKDLDVIIIAGDLFDRLLDFNSAEVHQILEFLSYLLAYCSDNNIMLRLLEGTPSHDWQQTEVINKLNDMRQIKCDMKYHKALDIEYIDKFNKHILYIPDEWSNSHSDIEAQIATKLQEHSISKVDIAVLHGLFTYQMPIKNYSGFCFKEEYFLRLVTGLIHIGHFHVRTTFERIIANGSLDRLSHGEEGPKGCLLVDGSKWTFLDNPHAFVYKTIKVIASTTIKTLDKHITELPKGSRVRLLVSKDHPLNISFQDVKLRYLDYVLSKINKENTSDGNNLTYILTDEELDMSNTFTLDKDIYNTLKTIVFKKYDLTERESNKFLEYTKVLENINQIEEEV